MLSNQCGLFCTLYTETVVLLLPEWQISVITLLKYTLYIYDIHARENQVFNIIRGYASANINITTRITQLWDTVSI